MGRVPDSDTDTEFSERLNGLTKRTLLSIASKISSSSNNPNNSNLLWFAEKVELFQFPGHDGFQLQGYHIPSIFKKFTGPDCEKPILELPVIVHCAGLSEATLKHVKLLRELSNRGFEIYSFDMRGHGFSAETGNNGGPILHAKSFSFFVSDLELFIRKKVRPSISAAKNAAARETAVAKSAAALALALENPLFGVIPDATSTIHSEAEDEEEEDTWKSNHSHHSKSSQSLLGEGDLALEAEQEAEKEAETTIFTDSAGIVANRRHSFRTSSNRKNNLDLNSSTSTVLSPTKQLMEMRSSSSFTLSPPQMTGQGHSQSLPGTPRLRRSRSLLSVTPSTSTPITSSITRDIEREKQETARRASVGQKHPVVFIGNAVSALVGLTLHAEKPGLMQKVVCISPCLRPLMDHGLRLIIAPMRFCGMGAMLAKRENKSKAVDKEKEKEKEREGRSAVSKENIAYWDDLCNLCPCNLKIQGSSIALTREVLRAANSMEKVSHRLCGGLLLLQAKSDTVVDNDATDSFYNNLEPSCKKLSTFRIVKNSHHDLLCSKEEVFGELLEEINFFVLP